MALIRTDERIAVEPDGFHRIKNYSFYKTGGQEPRLYQHILSTAKESIDIWDPYYTIEAANVFNEVRQIGIKINIITKRRRGADEFQTKADIDEFVNKIKNILGKKVNPQIEIYCIIKNSFERDWHDRYLVIDNKDAYLVGTSIDEQINPIKDFGIYHITDNDEVAYIKELMDQCKSKCKYVGYPNEINSYRRR